ncbi:MAG: MFS transporter [Intestinibacter bartlettii]|nr:MFS transporter [uncultured Intestinibacter sp.]
MKTIKNSKIFYGWWVVLGCVLITTTMVPPIMSLSNKFLIPVSMMVTNWFVEKRGIAMSVTMAGIGLGGTIFSLIVTDLLQNYGWRHTYLIMAGIILVVALPVASMYDLNGSYTLAWMLLLVLTAVTLFSWVGSCIVAKRYMASDVELKQAQ